MKNKMDLILPISAAVVLLGLSAINPWVGVGFGFITLLIDPLYQVFKKK
jgi:hypothetical protein